MVGRIPIHDEKRELDSVDLEQLVDGSGERALELLPPAHHPEPQLLDPRTHHAPASRTVARGTSVHRTTDVKNSRVNAFDSRRNLLIGTASKRSIANSLRSRSFPNRWTVI